MPPSKARKRKRGPPKKSSMHKRRPSSMHSPPKVNLLNSSSCKTSMDTCDSPAVTRSCLCIRITRNTQITPWTFWTGSPTKPRACNKLRGKTSNLPQMPTAVAKDADKIIITRMRATMTKSPRRFKAAMHSRRTPLLDLKPIRRRTKTLPRIPRRARHLRRKKTLCKRLARKLRLRLV